MVPIADITTETATRAFMHGWISRFGVPRIVISDRGSQFESALWCCLMQQLGIQRKRTTAYHPACNGAIERFHRIIKNALRTKCDDESWYSALPLVLLGIRSAINEQGYRPTQLLYGSNLKLPVQFFCTNKTRS